MALNKSKIWSNKALKIAFNSIFFKKITKNYPASAMRLSFVSLLHTSSILDIFAF